jgi:hypothetical protein
MCTGGPLKVTQPVRLAGVWCRFVLREKYFWKILVAAGWRRIWSRMPLQRSTGGATGFSRALQTPSFLMGLRPSTLVLLHILLQNRIFPPNNRDSLLYTTFFCTHLPSYQLPPRRSHSSASSPFISPPPRGGAAPPPRPAAPSPFPPHINESFPYSNSF